MGHCKSLDVAILEADRKIAFAASTAQRMHDLQFNCVHGEIHPEIEQHLSEICESMLPHKQILKDTLCDFDTQVRMETYNH